MKSKELIKEVRGMDKARALEALKSAQKDLLNLNFRKAVSGIPKTSELAATRKKIARIQTVLNERIAE